MHLCLLQREKDPKGNGSRGSNSEGQPIGGPHAFMTSSSSIGLDCDESLDAYMFIYLMLGAYWLHCLASGQSWSLSCREGVSGHSATSTSYTWQAPMASLLGITTSLDYVIAYERECLATVHGLESHEYRFDMIWYSAEWDTDT